MSRTMSRGAFLVAWALHAGAWAQADSTTGAASGQALGDCLAVAEDAQRLACYDGLARRSQMLSLPASPLPGAGAGSSLATPGQTPPAQASERVARAGGGLMSAYWELDDEDKRGTFNYTAYRPNYFMPLRWSSRTNSRPYTPVQGYAEGLPRYQHLETKVQLSLRSKLIQDMLLPGGDLWLGYTQESNWQLYNRGASAPFRNTDYQPELIFVAPVARAWRDVLPAGWQWRMVQAGFVHQSNGQTDPLSRSWNRLYAGLGVERGDLSLQWRVERRVDRNPTRPDTNPDIVDYLGMQQGQLSWFTGRAAMELTWRPSTRGRGSIRADWSYPVFEGRADGLRWYAQVFHGFGDSLLDYNLRQTTLGVGLSIFKF